MSKPLDGNALEGSTLYDSPLSIPVICYREVWRAGSQLMDLGFQPPVVHLKRTFKSVPLTIAAKSGMTVKCYPSATPEAS